jgi:hypothetical protein
MTVNQVPGFHAHVVQDVAGFSVATVHASKCSASPEIFSELLVPFFGLQAKFQCRRYETVRRGGRS